MAVYKVIQDIESEDKIVGFLTLKMFIYALISGALVYINIRFLMAGILGPVRFVFVFILFWPMLLFGTLAAPLGREQSTEVWILSRIRFYLKPRLRVWNQSGLLELVTITVPKKIERQLTKNLTQTEVRSRLKALATTMDSRGWAVRNVAVNLSANPSYLDIVEPESDRLAAGSNLPGVQTAADVTESDDIMDAQNNTTAQHFETLMQQEDEKRKKAVSEIVKKQPKQQAHTENENAEPPADYSFLDNVENKEGKEKDNKDTTSFVGRSIISPGSQPNTDTTPGAKDKDLSEAEKAYIEREHKKAEDVHKKSAGFKPKPLAITPELPFEQPKNDQAAMTRAVQTAKLEELAQSGNAFSVATVQKLANRDTENIRKISDNEVEISLHGN
jgi:hypothetical protein